MEELLKSDIFHVIDHAQMSINIISDAGVIVYANRFAMEKGIVPPYFIGKHLDKLSHEGKLISGSGIIALKEKRIVIKEVLHDNGRQVFSISTPVFAPDGRVAFVLTVARDIDDFYEVIQLLSARARKILHGEVGSSSCIVDYADVDMVAESEEMTRLMESVHKIAPTSATVLIMGESGVGKDVLANTIHKLSPRAGQPMMSINCGCIPSELMEAELFGYEKGIFTGATSARPGLFEEVNGGTLMLDEIGELGPALQVKLLRTLQNKKIRRIGGKKELSVDVRIIAATNRSLEDMVAQKTFRSDLYYRLNVFKIEIPPLRKRQRDLRALIPMFMQKHNITYGTSKFLSGEALREMLAYPWPGNIRELDNVVENIVLLSPHDKIDRADLPVEIRQSEKKERAWAQDENSPRDEPTLQAALDALEKRLLTEARHQYRTCRKMAHALGIDYSSVSRKLKKYGIP